MSPRIITADEAKALREDATPGPWRVWSDEGPIVLPTGERAGGWTCSVCRGDYTSNSDHVCVGYAVAKDEAQADRDARLIAAAPDLAHTVEALHAEVAKTADLAAQSRWSAMAARQDADQLAHVVGRTSYELLFVNGHAVTQTATAHVLADGRAYAPILGYNAPPVFASLDALARELERAFGDGFKYTGARPLTKAVQP